MKKDANTLINRLEKLIEKVDKTKDKCLIQIVNEEYLDIKNNIEKLKTDGYSSFDSIWEEINDFEEYYINKESFDVKFSEIEDLRYQLTEEYNFDISAINKEISKNKKSQFDKDSLEHTGFFLKDYITCVSCKKDIFIDEIKNNIVCPYCDKKNELSVKLWETRLSGNKTLNNLTNNFEYTTNFFPRNGVGYPRCTECNDSLSDEEYWTIKEIEEAKETGKLHCKKCNKLYIVKNADEFTKSLFKHQIIAIITEDQKKKDRVKNASSVKCSNCGANLRITKNKNTAICEYCNTENILPDIAYKPEVPVIQTIWVLLKMQHDIIFSKNNIDEVYYAFKQKLYEIDKVEVEKEVRKEKKERRKSIIGNGSVILVFLIFAVYYIIKEHTDLFGYAEVKEITNTNFSYIKSHKTDEKYNYKWGVINNKTDEICIPTGYKSIKYFFKDCFRVEDTNKQFGVVNSKNEILIPIEYNKIEYLADDDKIYGGGYFLLHRQNNTYSGLYNNKGEQVLSGEYNFEILNNYFIIHKENGKYGLADTLGNIVLPEKYFKIISIENNKVKVKKWKKGKTYFVDLKK